MEAVVQVVLQRMWFDTTNSYLLENKYKGYADKISYHRAF